MRATHPIRQPATAALIAVLAFAHVQADAQWLQWGGPNRDFKCPNTELALTWPDEGPARCWSTEIGGGHSAILVDDGRLYTMSRHADQDVVLCFDAETGKKIWKQQYDAPTVDGMQLEFGPGPHATPLIVGQRLYTIGAMVHLRCWNKTDGKLLWKHDLIEEMQASPLGRGYGASATPYEQTIIVNIGSPEVGVAAFDQESGKIVWKSEPFRGGYPTPMLAKIHDEPHLLHALAADRFALDPKTGQTRWKTTVDQQSAAIISSPLWVPPNKVFYTAAYGGGSRLFEITRDDEDAYTATELWHSRKLKVHHANVVTSDGVIYGSSGDFGPAFMMALRLSDGKVLWRKRGFSKATLLLVGKDKLIILDEQGHLAVATATPDELQIHAKAKVLEEKSWTVPTLVGTRLYLRDYHHIVALDLSPAANQRSAATEMGASVDDI